MANTIRIKRSTGSSAPTTLANAELAFAEGSSVGYIGVGTGGAGGSATSILKAFGPGAFLTLDTAQTVSGNKTFTGTVDLSGATVNGNTTFQNNLTVVGDLTVNGTTTTVNSTTVTVDDKNIELGSTASPTDAGADGGGITLKGATDKTIRWLDATDSWTFNQAVELEAGLSFRIDGTVVLSKTSLGSGVTGSSLTSLGTIGTGVWQGTTIGTGYGGTGQTSYTDGQLLIGNSSGGLTKATLTAGTGISITNGNGAITINAQETVSAGDGLDLNAGVFSVDLKANGGLVIESTELALDLGASSITGTLAVADGGTGATTLTGYVKGNGTSAMTASATIPNTDITGLGTMSTQNANNVAITGGTIDGITLDGGSY